MKWKVTACKEGKTEISDIEHIACSKLGTGWQVSMNRGDYMHWHILPNDPANFTAPTRGLNPETGETDPESVGYDIYAPADGFLDPLSRKLIPLGFRAEFANDHVGRYMDRSGMANKGVHMLGGVVDPSYRGEWKLILFNTNGETFRWKRGDRIIQVVFIPIRKPVPQIVASLSPSPRVGGLGSTGQ